MSLLGELRRRNVIRMAGLYLVGAWLLTQVASTVFPAFDVPAWALRALIIALALGFVPALVFSWVFELTPGGIKRDTEVKPEESIALQTARRMDRLIIVVLICALLYFAVDKFVLAPRRDAAPAAPTALPAQAAASGKSIAVLAFTDLSPAHDQGYFSDGMSEEILNALAQVNDLKVAGRTSSFYYKGRNEDLRAIGKALGVANILEGSVRKQGNAVRITAQLIRVADDTHLWSHAYDGDLSDVFKLQESIARAITDQLKVVLAGDQKARLVNAGTTNSEAYNLYLHATDAFNRRDYALMGEAIGWLRQAIELDPNFARAQSRLAMIHVLGQARYGASLSEVEPHAHVALALDPADVEAQVALGMLARRQRRFIDARVALDRALALVPNDASVHLYAGQNLIDTGYTREGIAHLDRALDIDPLLPNALYWRGRQYLYAGNIDGAERLFKKADELGLTFAVFGRGAVARARGDLALARALSLPTINATAGNVGCPRNPAVDTPIYLDGVLGGDAAARAKAIAVLDACLAGRPATVPMIVPFGLMNLGQPARALAVVALGPTSDDAGFFMGFWGPEGRDARRLPEFAAFARNIGFVGLWDKYGPPDLCKKNTAGNYECE